MRGTSWAIGLLFVAVGSQPACDQAVNDGTTPLEGTWLATGAVRDGLDAEDVVGHRLSIEGSEFQIRSADGTTLFAGSFRLDRTVAPAAIDFDHAFGPLQGKRWLGIYALDGGTLRICDNAPDLAKARPGVFEAGPGSGHVFITFTRMTP